MEFLYQTQQLHPEEAGRVNTFLLTNGLGGYASMSAVFSAPRCDQGVLVAAIKAPNVRYNLVHRIRETVSCGGKTYTLSGQSFADGTPAEEGWRYLQSFRWDGFPAWTYRAGDVELTRQLCMERGKNTAAVLYTVTNNGDSPVTLTLTPSFKFAPKEDALQEPKDLTLEGTTVRCGGCFVNIFTNGELKKSPQTWQTLAYPEDAVDGRPGKGMAGSCCVIEKVLAAGETGKLEAVFTMEETTCTGSDILKKSKAAAAALLENCGFTDPAARQLVLAADAYIARRESTGGKTILAGYPLFSDWGRDTMIALPGCCLATGRFEDAKSILRTFLAYERDGLVPNLFPEGENAPMYNTVDAALILIDSVWQYVQRTGDWAFAWEAWDTMDRIITNYRKGTHHGIGMDEDGLIFAGQGLDQVTWMDVCVQGILPTPRHGKPVEINAYWYNALIIMDKISQTLGHDRKDFADLAEQVRASFIEKFYIPEKGYLKDVISGTDADEQIRCNQIWALSMSHTMLSETQEKNVLETVRKHLYTPYGLRTLSPRDPQYQPYYGGEQLKRDLAYHQGTTWVFPMGAYYRAWLKVHGNTPEAVQTVKEGLANIPAMLYQGCAGQLPEIYDGENPSVGKGCFAQAWSVGEILRVYEAIEKIEKDTAQ